MEDYEARKARNENSLGGAEHHREAWLDYELELLMEWDHSEEGLAELAELLGRTIEACRQRYYEARKGRRRTRSVERTTTTVTTTRVVWQDDDEWNPEWYVRG